MRSIVSGANGFIGSHLVDALLAQGKKVVGLDNRVYPNNLSQHDNNPNFKQYTVDIRHYIDDFFLDLDTIFHLAALADIVPSIENPVDYFSTNVTGTLNVLEAARKAGCKRFIYAASASCYGANPKIPSEESGLYNENYEPAYPYALTKYLGEQLVMHWSKVYGIPAISLRLFNVYGPRSRTTGTYGAMFGTFLAQIANNKPVTIVGDGTQKRDFIYVTDVVEAILLAAESDVTGIFNVGSGTPSSVNRIVELLGAKESVNIPKRPGEPDVTCADISKIKYFLGWEPKISIEEGVARLLTNINFFRDAPIWVPETIATATKSWFERLQ